MDRDDALNELVFDWGDAYDISEALGVWRAVRRDTGWTLIGEDAGELRDEIRADYQNRPVPRSIG